MGQRSAQKCPECGTKILRPQSFCGECGERLFQCPVCKAINLQSSAYCHNCGNTLKLPEALSPHPTPSQNVRPIQPAHPRNALNVPPVDTGQNGEMDDRVLGYLEAHQGGISITRTSQDLRITTDQLIASLTRLQTKGRIQRDETPFVERMRNCHACAKAIGADEPFCRYCGAKQAVTEPAGPQPILDPRTMKVALTMLGRVVEAKDHPEYAGIDELTTTIGAVALGGQKPQDAQELSFQDQLKLLTLVFEYTRDKVIYKGEVFGEHVRWPWETLKTGGDCDCKAVLLASMLASLAYRRMHFLILPPGTYLDTTTREKRKLPGHALVEVELLNGSKGVPVRLDPSCIDCDVDEISSSMKPYLSSFYRIPIIPSD